MQIPVREHTLDNGLRVVVSPDPAVPVAAVALYYDVGSRNEEKGRSGFAHLFEHMMFQGSAHVGKAEHFAHIQGIGGQTNATTSEDRTNYYATVPSNQLDLALWLEADRMRSLQVTPENFENQRQTVIEEKKERIDNAPYGFAMVEHGEQTWGSWAYGHPVIGYEEDLHACTYDEVVAFHSRYYRPNNAVLSVAGDVDEAQVVERIREWFGDIEPGEPTPTPDVAEVRRTASKRLVREDGLARLPALFINHQCPGFGHKDFFAFEVLETALLRGPSSRAHRRLVVEGQLAIQASGGFDAKRGPGVFALSAVTSQPGELDAVEAAWLQLLDEVAREPIPPDEWQKVVARLRAACVYSVEGVLARAMQLGRAGLYLNEPGWDNHYIERLEQVTPEDVLRVAGTWLTGDTHVSMRVHPA
ncbi:MAG: insulinase family protein [Proteobacteria bacterium]|nr:insulinase family protein [Pseudomonadota bacterium]MCP4921785.1 insulinase family protein [Pseudomonadota bacterium]